jgi:hypothetical protein
MLRAFHTAPASLTGTCAPRERPQPGQPRSFVPRRRLSLFLTESKLGCSTALTYLRRGGRRRGAPRYSRFFRPAVTLPGMGPGSGAQLRPCQPAALRTLSFRRATLGDQAASYSDSDLSYQQGQWRLGSASANGDSAAGGSTSRDTAAPARKIEEELRTLWVAAFTLLTSSERKDQATRAKLVAGTKRSRSYPGDEETECLDATLNPFAEWPWEQSLRLTPRWRLRA